MRARKVRRRARKSGRDAPGSGHTGPFIDGKDGDVEPPAAHLRRNITGALRLAWAASPRGFLATALLSMLTGVGPPVVVWLSKRLVDLVVEGAAAGRPPARLGPTVVALGLVGAGARALTILQSHRQILFAKRVELSATRRFLVQSAAVDLGHVDDGGRYAELFELQASGYR
jgi:hypothetical protein